MKKSLQLIMLTLVLSACSTRGNRFKMEGRLLNLNQGEFHVYSPDGLLSKVDTIRVEGGRFTYQLSCSEPGTIVIVFPNYSQQPIFVTPGKKVSIKGDASHLKEMSVEGTDDNELMTAFRQHTKDAAPPEVESKAHDFIKNNPTSAVAVYLWERYFVQAPDPDYGKVLDLAELLVKNQPKNGRLIRISNALKPLRKTQANMLLSPFEATDINGRPVRSSDLRGKPGVVVVWSSWSYESQDALRRIKRVSAEAPGKLGVVTISVDASRRECRDYLRRDSLPWPIICDERVFDSPLLEKLGMKSVPDNIVLNSEGRIVGRGLSPDMLKEKLEELVR